MHAYNVAILGATGAVGLEIIKILEETHFPIHYLKCLASSKSVGKPIHFNHQTIFVEEATAYSFENIDLVFGAVNKTLSTYFAPFIQKSQAIYIDNSSAFRNDFDVPLVIPEINGEDCFTHQGIIANPNCSTIIACTACYPIHQLFTLQSLIVTTFQAVSGAGILGMNELMDQMNAKEGNQTSVFDYPILHNIIPQIGSILENGFSDEEMKMLNESRRIFHDPNLQVTCTCVRVPVLRTHSLSISCKTKKKFDLLQLHHQILHNPSLQLLDCPMPLNTTNQDLVTIGRIRENEQGISLWCCGDQLRKGAATNAVQIAQFCHKFNLISPRLV